jgi:hypothetical protein
LSRWQSGLNRLDLHEQVTELVRLIELANARPSGPGFPKAEPGFDFDAL